MLRILLLLIGLAIVGCVALYFRTRRTRYLDWALRLFLACAGAGVLFLFVFFLKRFI